MGNRLLLADDSITIQKVVAIIFANEEFELTVVDNGTAALEKARETKPDVMLVDALMPGKTGYEVCAEIRRDPVLGAVPIILLIGAFEPLDEEKARECGADATISKPFESQQLIDRVKEMLELGKTRKTAPPVAQPAAPAPAAEEIWGDLSSLDAMAPAAAAPVAAAPAAAAPAAAEEDIWESVGIETEPAWEAPAAPPEPAWEAPVAAAAPAAQVEPVEASMEDDLWGAFELEEETPAAAVEAPSELFGVVEPEAADESEFEAEEIFNFDETEEIEETGPALDLEEPAVDSSLTVSEEEFFAFSEEPEAAVAVPAQAETEAEAEAFGVPEYEPFEFEAEEPAPQAAASAAAAQPEPVFAAPAPAAPLQAAAPQAAAPQPAAVAELTEDQLVAALSKVSREVIERIVWEVVPDLAEVIIKEEIRKLKSGVRG
ncbi:response regulator [Geomonas nitrogeniifigens]|uniref:Response regulator n=1 Tax=Geomonas diazotrophica TaxID=2843197 RepID=A0ABX8JFS4_9BACT|nr:response regulator [Geomonas nitrogeniifigens]QWV96052.1 response regulator [Geomonas nitrogeniifigens]